MRLMWTAEHGVPAFAVDVPSLGRLQERRWQASRAEGLRQRALQRARRGTLAAALGAWRGHIACLGRARRLLRRVLLRALHAAFLHWRWAAPHPPCQNLVFTCSELISAGVHMLCDNMSASAFHAALMQTSIVCFPHKVATVVHCRECVEDACAEGRAVEAAAGKPDETGLARLALAALTGSREQWLTQRALLSWRAGAERRQVCT